MKSIKYLAVKKITKVHYSLHFGSTNIFLPNKNQQTPHGTKNIFSSHSKGNSQIKSLLQPNSQSSISSWYTLFPISVTYGQNIDIIINNSSYKVDQRERRKKIYQLKYLCTLDRVEGQIQLRLQSLFLHIVTKLLLLVSVHC